MVKSQFQSSFLLGTGKLTDSQIILCYMVELEVFNFSDLELAGTGFPIICKKSTYLKIGVLGESIFLEDHCNPPPSPAFNLICCSKSMRFPHTRLGPDGIGPNSAAPFSAKLSSHSIDGCSPA
jgi:hypothetical protein